MLSCGRAANTNAGRQPVALSAPNRRKNVIMSQKGLRQFKRAIAAFNAPRFEQVGTTWPIAVSRLPVGV